MKALTIDLKKRVDAFLDESLILEGPHCADDTEIALCEAIEVVLRRRRNKRLLFSRLPVDVVHDIFGHALDLERIHERDLPMDTLEEHRKQLFRMRCVSMTWNDFLTSAPQYWLAVNLRTPPDILRLNLERAQQAPLCIYSIVGRRQKECSFSDLETLLTISVAHTKTVRSEDEYFAHLWKTLLKNSAPTLEYIDLATPGDWGAILDPPLMADCISNELPMVRELTARGWQPRADATWLANLQCLSLGRPIRIGADLIHVLSHCTNLEKLCIDTDGTAWGDEDPPVAALRISLPHLQKLQLEFDVLTDMQHMINRFDIPRNCQGSVRINYAPQSEEVVADLPAFIYAKEPKTNRPTDPVLLFNALPRDPVTVTYKAGNRSIQFPVPDRTEEWDLFQNIVIALQNGLNNPPLTVELDTPALSQAEALRRLGDLNVKSVRVIHTGEWLDNVLAAIASRKPALPTGSVEDGHAWPFESLRDITFEDSEVPLSQIARTVGIRQRYLRQSSREWLKTVRLVDCGLKGALSLRKATNQLEAINVALVTENCRHRFKD